jgi:hypothetical protein
MGTGKLRINSAGKVLVAQAALVIARVASGEPVAQEALAGLAAQVAREALAELVVRVVPAVLAAQEALAELVVRVAPAGLAAQVAQEALAELVVRVAPVAPELVIGPAVGPQRVIGQEEAEQVLGPVAAEQELVQVVAELGLVLVAVLLRTKSVTAAHHRGLVPVPRVEDSAAAAETTRVPAAAEVGTAWEAAATAVVVVVVVAVAVEA